MKRFRRIISLALATVLTLAALVTVTNATQFTDVPSTAPLLDAINYAVDNNFIEPTSSTTFSPNSYMTRGNMVLMLYRHSGETASSTNTGFTDVPSSSVYARAVVWAVAKGITNGTSDTTFEPSTNIKRQDAAVFMYRYAQYMVHRTDYTSTLAGFTDSGRVQSYALPAMQWAVGAGIISGTTSTTLEPRVALKRGAAVAMLQRYGLKVEILRTPRVLTSATISRNFYGFTNDPLSFKHSGTGAPFHPNASCYYIDEDDINILIYYSYETGDAFSDRWDKIDNWILNAPWGGSCFGMCISMLLDKAGQINVNNRLNNTLFLSEITRQTINARIESLINYYFVLQAVRGEEYSYENNIKGKQLYDSIRNNGLCKIGIAADFDPTDEDLEGHSLIGYHAMPLGNNRYRMYVYDPNYTTMNSYLLLELDNNNQITTFTYHENGTQTGLPVEGMGFRIASEVCEDFKAYDIDGDFNTGVPEAATASLDESNLTIHENASISKKSLFADMVSESKTTLYVNCNDDFTITNPQGDYLIYDSQTLSFSGNMTLYRQAATFINGFTHVLTVPAYDSYEITTNADKVCFNVLSKNTFNGIEATNAKSIKISENDEMTVSGNNTKVVSTYGTAKVDITTEVK